MLLLVAESLQNPAFRVKRQEDGPSGGGETTTTESSGGEGGVTEPGGGDINSILNKIPFLGGGSGIPIEETGFQNVKDKILELVNSNPFSGFMGGGKK